jgi:DNA transformation protein
MSTDTGFVGFVSELLEPLGPLTSGRFFGGHAFKSDGVQFAMIMGSTLYFCVDDATRPDFEAAGSEPFRYSTRKREVTVGRYYTAPEFLLDEPDELVAWARRALEAAR